MSALLQGKKFLKGGLRVLHRILPRPAYDAVYRFAQPVYKKTVRGAYLMWGAVAYSWRDRERWRMMVRVHQIMPFTLVGTGGLEATFSLAGQMNDAGIPGDFVELGVARGGCAALLGGTIFGDGNPPIAATRRLWLFDSYEGLPDPTEKDFRLKGDTMETGDHVTPLVRGSCLGMLDDVKHLLLEEHRFPEAKLEFVKGWFQDTVPTIGQQIDKIAVLRIDGDWYESTKVCLEGLYDKVQPNGAIIIDDYQSCYGCELAVTEFLTARQLNVDIQLDGRGGCYWLKS